MTLPECFRNETELDTFLAQPPPTLVETMRRFDGDLLILGAAGKMGVTLALQARRAATDAGQPTRRVIAVSRFGDSNALRRLQDGGCETLTCDLLNRAEVAGLPQVPNVIFMAGRKFGTDDDASLTWATNTVLPAYVGEHFLHSRVVVFSTGCVYPLVTPESGGSRETDPPAPVGEYAQSCLGRERVFDYFSRRFGLPVCHFRLNYAIDLRYGVLHDLSRQILSGQPVNLNMGWFNCIWQGDATAWALQSLEHCSNPPTPINITGLEILSVRSVAEKLGRELRHPVKFSGREEATAYLSNAQLAHKSFGPLTVPLETMIHWTAAWLRAGGRSLERPTHFNVRDGSF